MRTAVSRPKILTFVDHYLPGYKSGGPLRAISNLVENLGDEFSFMIVTRDRDKGEAHPYASVRPDRWQDVGRALVRYTPFRQMGAVGLWRLIRDTDHDVLYLNSFFSARSTVPLLILRRLGLLKGVPLLIAPRGELSAGALRVKPIKKRAFLKVARKLALHRGVVWQASSEYEAEDIRRVLGSDTHVMIAPDLGATGRSSVRTARKEPGRLRVVFASRIAPKKNLDGALRILAGVRRSVDFTIIGPVDDAPYWSRCQRLMADMPSSIRVTYLGPQEHSALMMEMTRHDVFLLPTWSENFGYVILEAMAAGLPVLIGDATAWRDLEERFAGWDVDPEDVDRYRTILERCVDMDADEHAVWSEGAQKYASCTTTATEPVAMNHALLSELASRRIP
jgi:glycosyltransferase involved in cell wall biosynthesis